MLVPGANGAGADGAVRLVAAGLLLGAAFALKDNAGLHAFVVLFPLASGGDERADGCAASFGSPPGPPLVIPLALFRSCSGKAARSTISTRRRSPTTCSTRARHTRAGGTWSAIWRVSRPACACRSVVVRRWSSGASSHCPGSVVRAAQAAAWHGSGRLGGDRLPLDRDQRQPELPQYFLQAAPALALAAGLAAAIRAAPTAGHCEVGDRVAGRSRRHGGSATIRSRSSPATSGTTRITLSAGSTGGRTWPLRRARDSDKYSALDNMDIGSFLASQDDAGRDGLCVRLFARLLRLREPAQRVALLLEPAGDPRFQPRGSALRRRRASAPISSATPGVCRPAASTTGPRRAGLGALLHVAAAARRLAARRLSPRSAPSPGGLRQAWERNGR